MSRLRQEQYVTWGWEHWDQSGPALPHCEASYPLLRGLEIRGEPLSTRVHSDVAEDWREQFRAAIDQLAVAKVEASKASRIERLEQDLAAASRDIIMLKQRIAELEEVPESVVVPITTLAPEPFEMIQPLLVLVEPVVGDLEEDCEYVATFVDAEIGASGDTIAEAVSCLKDRVLAQFDMLERMPRTRLGKGPKRQLAVLESVIRRVV